MSETLGFAIVPTPTDEEAAAIVVAVELAWPRPVVMLASAPTQADTPSWRWSGRWWANGLQRGRRI